MHFTSKSTIHLFIQFFNKYLLISYTVEVTNRFKGLDLIDGVPEEPMDGGSSHCTGGSDQDNPQEKEMQKGKMVV